MNAPKNPSQTATVPPGAGVKLNVGGVMLALAFFSVLLVRALQVEQAPPEPLGGYPALWNLPAMLGVICLAMLGVVLAFRLGWSRRRVNLLGGVAVIIIATVALSIVWKQVQITSRNLAIAGSLNQLRAALDQVALEKPQPNYRYEELVGPGRMIPSIHAQAGEDYTKLFPRGLGEPWIITGASGRTVRVD